jgi:hypothetical protein
LKYTVLLLCKKIDLGGIVMDKFLAILNVIVFGILFAGAVDIVYIKKSFKVDKEISNVDLIGLFMLFGLPVMLGIVIIFKVGI